MAFALPSYSAARLGGGLAFRVRYATIAVASMSPADTAACQFAFEVAAFHRAPPYLEEEIQKHFSSRQILDLTLLTSYYLSVAAIAITDKGLRLAVAEALGPRFLDQPGDERFG